MPAGCAKPTGHELAFYASGSTGSCATYECVCKTLAQYVIVSDAASCAAAGLATVAEADCDAARTALGIPSYQTGAGLGEPYGCIAVKNHYNDPTPILGKWQTRETGATTCDHGNTFDCICQQPSTLSPPPTTPPPAAPPPPLPPPILHALAAIGKPSAQLVVNEYVDRVVEFAEVMTCLLYTSPSPRD